MSQTLDTRRKRIEIGFYEERKLDELVEGDILDAKHNSSQVGSCLVTSRGERVINLLYRHGSDRIVSFHLISDSVQRNFSMSRRSGDRVFVSGLGDKFEEKLYDVADRYLKEAGL